MIIIGIGYKARHGKNTAARAMALHAARRNFYVKEYAFADALKSFARVLGMREKNGSLLQVLGTEVFRSIDPDIWVRVLLDTVNEQQPDIAVITDMRYPNEALAIRNAGGFLVNVLRLNEDGTPWVSLDRSATHLSETSLDTWTDWDSKIKVHNNNLGALRRHSEEVLDFLVNEDGA
jgi:hypothetical protein